MEFEDCIEEHPKAKIWPKLLNFQNAGYKHTKLVVYYILVIIIGIPLTFIWACINGTVVFSCVWCWGPLLKLIKLCVFSTAPAITFPYQMWCSPIVDIFARLFRQIRLQAVVQKVWVQGANHIFCLDTFFLISKLYLVEWGLFTVFLTTDFGLKKSTFLHSSLWPFCQFSPLQTLLQ